MFKNVLWVTLIINILTACGPGAQKLLENGSQLPGSNGSPASKSDSLSGPENEFLARINGLRAQYDLPLLQISPALQAAARNHSEYMNSNGFLSHSEPSPNLSSGDRIRNAGGDFDVTGENIAYGSDSAERTYLQWFNSTGHLHNMLSVNYQYIGIARAGLYWTTDFGGF
jgi:uncharacterized protein YkwD